jgi:hypothetical protein
LSKPNGILVELRSVALLDELDRAIDEVRQHLDSIRAAIAALPEDQRQAAIAAVLSATQNLGDLYSDFAADMLRVPGSQGSA